MNFDKEKLTEIIYNAWLLDEVHAIQKDLIKFSVVPEIERYLEGIYESRV